MKKEIREGRRGRKNRNKYEMKERGKEKER